MLLGAHVSISGTIDRAVDRARELKCTTFQLFTRNPRGWKAKKLKKEEIEEFKRKMKEYGYGLAVSHMPYLPNISSPLIQTYKKSLSSLIEELERAGELSLKYLVVHIGSHLGKGLDIGIKKAAESVNTALSKVNNDVVVLLENMAGQRNSVGSRFEDIKRILNLIEYPDRVGVCFDTCHAFAAGYDLRTREAIENTLRDFDEIIGLRLLKAVHINDSKGDLGSHLDRHEHIGMGKIGENGFRELFHNKYIRDLPLILETPVDSRGNFATNLAKCRELYI
ncbi:MAG: deoxyribonuclease IV [Aigarchaeota archaeon]|nr:deoxyribonuclease IV [Aigarchaeota archaeon]MCX8192659.1 deoxyribonuclease IV [Nitrososphaeria archaeon]MDW7985619.1 deoxyribonuclease IV [Nitrososphaerota archaeon]